jgi:hypothetical protein
MGLYRTRTLRGALAGATAAAVWAAQQPLDKKIFGVDYDDVEILGKLVTRSRGWLPVGMVLHIQNGAVFGAVYANVAPSLPGPSWARGVMAGLTEHLGTWPLMRAVDRLHPAREQLPPLWGNARAFAQSAWRHLVFALVLAELERRLNPPEDEGPGEVLYSSNGHGSIDHLVTAG